MTLGTMATDVEQRIDFDALRAYRLGRAQAQLQKNGYGSFLCFDLDNIRYITGTALAEWTRGKWVRWCLLTPEGPPVLWEKSSAAAVKRELCPWIPPENIRTSIEWKHGANPRAVTESQIAKVVGEIKQALEERGVADQPVAVDDADLFLLEGLRGAGLTVANGLEALFDARLIKSAEELKIIELSASLVDGVYAQLAHFIRPGVKENEVVAEISHWLIAHGAERITGINCVSGPRSNPHPHDYSDRMIRPGDLVFIDIMSHYLGYATCYYRTFAVTTASQRQKDIYKRANEWLEASIDRVRPGATTADIASAWPSAADLGYPSERDALGLAVGHGIGISHHEKPWITRNWSLENPVPIEAGMHFALETFCGEGEDGARIESQVIVTETGHRVITKWPSDRLLVLDPW
jgi:Xaa-Pro aminopeptidase